MKKLLFFTQSEHEEVDTMDKYAYIAMYLMFSAVVIKILI